MGRLINFICVIVVLLARVSVALQYTINFMWTFAEPKPTEQFIFPPVRLKTVEPLSKKEVWDLKVVDDWIVAWLKQNPEEHFVFWYDGSTVSQEQLTKTTQLFASLKATYLFGQGQFELKDVRDLQLVKANPEIFSPSTPGYLQVDLFRLIAAREYVDSCQTECAFVYADVDKGLKLLPDGSFQALDLTRNDLFNAKNLDSLQKVGLILNSNQENNFFILGNHNKTMLKAIDEIGIKSSFERIPALKEEIEFLKLLMAKKVAHKADVDRVAYEAVNRVYDTMVNAQLPYFNHLNNSVELVPDPSFGTQEFFRIFSKIDVRLGRNVNNSFTFKQKGPDVKRYPQVSMGGSSSASYLTPLHVREAIFGAALYGDWLKDYASITDEDRVTKTIHAYLVWKKFINDSATISWIKPQSGKAEKIFFIKDGDQEWAAKLFKDGSEFIKESRLIDKHTEIIDELPKINRHKLPIPQLMKSLAAFFAGDKGVIFMEKARGETIADIFDRLPQLTNEEIVAIFKAIGSQYAHLQAIYANEKNMVLFSYDQNSGTLLFDTKEMKSYWIDLDLREDHDLDEMGLVNTIDKESYFYEFTQQYFIRKFSLLGFENGLSKYFLALLSMNDGYNDGLFSAMPKEIVRSVMVQPNQRMKKVLSDLIEHAVVRFRNIEKTRKIEECEKRIRDENDAEVKKQFQSIAPLFKDIVDIDSLF